MKPVKLLAVAALVVLVALGITAAATAQSDDEKVVLTVGLTQDLDTPNPTVSELVSSYELNTIRYATLTDLAAADFSTTPGLAESWSSEDGKTWTYTLREGLEWSDGTPLTAEDVAYTINRSRDEEWLNYTATTANLEAEATDDRTVVVTSSVNDPKLPGLSVYILPKHIYEKVDADDIGTYTAVDDVASGPFQLKEWKKGQFWRMEANPSFWRGQVAIDEVIFRVFRNADAMVAALKSGELDAAHNVPAATFPQLSTTEGIVGIEGEQGGFDYLVLNAYADKPPRDTSKFDAPHPALLDLRFRQAIAHAIDKETLVERVYSGIGTPGTTMSPSANPAWIPELSAEDTYDFDLEKSKQILEDAGYTDSNGDGIREYEGENIVLRYAIRTESEYSKPFAGFITGWLKEIGIDTHVEVVRRRAADRGRGQGRLRPLRLGLDAVRRPRSDAVLLPVRPDRGRCVGLLELLQRHRHLRPAVRRPLQAAEHRARPRHSQDHGPRHADAVLQGRRVRRPRHDARPAGPPYGPLRGVGSPARRDRSGALLELVAVVLEPDAHRRCGRRQRVVVERADRDRGRRRDRHRARRVVPRQTAKRRGARVADTTRLSRTELDP